MKRGLFWLFGVASAAGAVAVAVTAPASAVAIGTGAPRYGCVETATEGELRLDLGSGEGGAWRGELVLTIVDGASQLAGTVYDTTKVGAKSRKPPKLQLKAKSLNAAQRAELLRDLTAAINRPEELPECSGPMPHSAKLSWTCAKGATKTGGDVSFDGDRCGGKARGYARAVGVSDWATALVRHHGGR